MSVVVIAVGLVCGGITAAAIAAFATRRGSVCPGCRERRLKMHDFIRATAVDGAGKRYPAAWTAYRCTACGAEYRRYVGGELITKEAFDAGAREPIPRATVVRSDDQ